MIIAYTPTSTGFARSEVPAGGTIPLTAVWIDLFNPTHEEQLAAEHLMGAEIPTREEIASIETSERLYDEPGAIVMTALLPMAARMPDPKMSSVTFVLSAKRLVTVRYGEPQSIINCSRRVQSDSTIPRNGPGILFVMLDIIIDRCADVLEEASDAFDKLSSRVFEEGLSSRQADTYRAAIRTQGRIGLQVARMHDVCASLIRLFLFLSSRATRVNLTEDQVASCKTFGRDIQSIKEHADALDTKLAFLLDATVGLVNLEQNQIIKIFSVVAVIFMPPTLIASVYGMNFAAMPELQWAYGYPYSLGLMLVSVALTFLYFRLKKLL
ncbi:magnesium transporter [Microvirga tunisiensis]|uniref:Magnesium transporter n=2 Tax=Pannonibacter tanglangensis TaxID=2750084 RepID=A0ABW9ZHH5_9HYPH|nr:MULTISPECIES: magnesium transporter CorA family protein [unclassified Pannonibacter]NBN64315.1 magnesium transporter [Pannonibacter sp. XCT-34]NBN78848.1 magnesium transporter [Pannonibacter sp. XCT-53]